MRGGGEERRPGGTRRGAVGAPDKFAGREERERRQVVSQSCPNARFIHSIAPSHAILPPHGRLGVQRGGSEAVHAADPHREANGQG
jgi:hypothetical protein